MADCSLILIPLIICPIIVLLGFVGCYDWDRFSATKAVTLALDYDTGLKIDRVDFAIELEGIATPTTQSLTVGPPGADALTQFNDQSWHGATDCRDWTYRIDANTYAITMPFYAVTPYRSAWTVKCFAYTVAVEPPTFTPRNAAGESKLVDFTRELPKAYEFKFRLAKGQMFIDPV